LKENAQKNQKIYDANYPVGQLRRGLKHATKSIKNVDVPTYKEMRMTITEIIPTPSARARGYTALYV
jgi:hypothetical protein